MKTRGFFVLIVFLIGITSCSKDEVVDTGIAFSEKGNASGAIVSYNEIVGYDSTYHTFLLTETAYQRIISRITPGFPDPGFSFDVRLNNQLIYTADFVPFYHSSSRNDIITFVPHEPGLIAIKLGYQSPPELFTGTDHRNDSRIIEQLKKDNKLMVKDTGLIP